MAKTQKYSDTLLLEAVLKYSDVCTGKIKYVDLAEWASANIPGLEGVRDYHFSRQMVEVDKATGRKKTVVKECTKRIEELNKARSVAAGMDLNPLLHSNRVDEFFDLPRHKQVDIILETRKQLESVMRSVCFADLERNRLQQENNLLRDSQGEMVGNLKALSDKLAEFGGALRALKQYINNDLQRKALESIGLVDGEYYDLERFYQSLCDDIEVLFMDKDRPIVEQSTLRDSILAGINFDDENGD